MASGLLWLALLTSCSKREAENKSRSDPSEQAADIEETTSRLPPAPQELVALEQSLAARPSWASVFADGDLEWARPSAHAASKGSPAEAQIAGLWCEVQAVKPALAGDGNWVATFITPSGAIQQLRLAANDTLFVPLVRPAHQPKLAVQLSFADRLDLLEFGMGVLTVALLPPLLGENAPISVGEVTLSLSGKAPWRAGNEGFTFECLPVLRKAVEDRIAPLLERAQRGLQKAKSVGVDVRAVTFNIPNKEQEMARSQIERAAHLVGWSDPRIETLIKYEAALTATHRKQANEQLRLYAKPTQQLFVREVSVRIDSPELHCEGKAVPSACSLVLDAELSGGEPVQAAQFFTYATPSLVDANAERHSLRLSSESQNVRLSGKKQRLEFVVADGVQPLSPAIRKMLRKHLRKKPKAQQEALNKVFAPKERVLRAPAYLLSSSDQADGNRTGQKVLSVQVATQETPRQNTD